MEFTYTKSEKVDLLEGRKGTEHRFEIAGTDFAIEASEKGFRFVGTSPWIMPVEADGINHMPVEMSALASVLDNAAAHAWKEIQKFRRDDIAKKMIEANVH